MSTPNFFRYHTDAIAALKPGQHVQFIKGQGYYVMPGDRPSTPAPVGPGPAEPKSGFGVDPYTGLPKNKAPKANPYVVPTRPRPPAPLAPPASPAMGPLTPAQIEAQAGLAAQSQLTPQQDEIRRQQALAAAQAKADEGAITGFQTAAAGILKDAAPLAGDAYQRAAQEEGALGQGLATGVSQDVADRVAADKEFMASQGQQGGPGPDTAALHDTVYGLTGQIPGDTFAEQGAAQTAYGAAMPAIALNAGREEMDARMAQARQDQDTYAQQLIQVAQQYPGFKAQALQQLNQYELDKANYRQSVRTNDASIASQRRGDALAARQQTTAERSLHDQEVAAGITTKQKADESAYKWASLTFETQKAATAAQQAQARIAASGRKVNAAASKNVGYVVDNNGRPILDAAGKRISVKQSVPKKTDPAKVTSNAASQAASYLQRATKVDANTNSPTYGKVALTQAQAYQGLYELVYAELSNVGWSKSRIDKWVRERVSNVYKNSGTTGSGGAVLPPAK